MKHVGYLAKKRRPEELSFNRPGKNLLYIHLHDWKNVVRNYGKSE